MTHRQRKFLSAVLLLVWLPLYVVIAATIVSKIERPHIVLEVALYVVLGVAWALPFRAVFRGVGREDPAKKPPED